MIMQSDNVMQKKTGENFAKAVTRICSWVFAASECPNETHYGVVDVLCACLLTLVPLLQHYKGIVVEASICVLVFCLPYIGIRFIQGIKRLDMRALLFALPLVAFQIYRVFAHGTTFIELAHGVTLSAYFVAAAAGCIDLRSLIRGSLLVALAASMCIILQYICYYVFGFHLQLVVTDLLLEESSAWVLLAQTGIIGVTGQASAFYRPSAFFLEPSHLYLYTLPHLFLLLLSPDMKKSRYICAALLSFALIFSTSGMGIALVVGVWLLHLGFSSGIDNQLRFRFLFRWKNIRNCILFVLLFAVLCFCLPFLRGSITRIFVGDRYIVEETVIKEPAVTNTPPADETGEVVTEVVTREVMGVNAISGRTTEGFKVVKRLEGQQLLLGLADNPETANFNKSGFVATMFKYGIVGTLVSYLFYLYCAVFLKAPHRWMAIIILVTSVFSAHTHGTAYMLYYVLILMAGCFLRRATYQNA